MHILRWTLTLLYLALAHEAVAASQKPAFLCMAEHAAYVGDQENVIDSGSMEDDTEWIVSEKGVNEPGKEMFLNSCGYQKGRPTFCEDDGDSWAGNFLMTDDNIFKMVLFIGDEDQLLFVNFVGRCRQLEADLS